MNVLAASCVVLVVAVGIMWFRLPHIARHIFSEGRYAASLVADGSLPEARKEHLLQSCARRMMLSGTVLIAGNVVSIVLPLLLVVVLDRVELVSAVDTMSVLVDPRFLILTGAVIGVVSAAAWRHMRARYEI
jgi:hypothetical protein